MVNGGNVQTTRPSADSDELKLPQQPFRPGQEPSGGNAVVTVVTETRNVGEVFDPSQKKTKTTFATSQEYQHVPRHLNPLKQEGKKQASATPTAPVASSTTTTVKSAILPSVQTFQHVPRYKQQAKGGGGETASAVAVPQPETQEGSPLLSRSSTSSVPRHASASSITASATPPLRNLQALQHVPRHQMKAKTEGGGAPESCPPPQPPPSPDQEAPSLVKPGAVRVIGPDGTTALHEEEEEEEEEEKRPLTGDSDQAKDEDPPHISAEIVPDEHDIEREIHQKVQDRLDVHLQTVLEAVPAATVLKDRRSCKIKLIVVLLVLVLASVGATVGILLGNNNSGNNSSQPVTSSPQPATCDFCFGGQNVSSTLTDVELETVLVADNVTCLDYLKSQQMLLSNDTECLVGQALAWRRCGCPLMPTISNGNCTLCDNNNNNNNQTPPVPLNAGVNCEEEANFVSVVGTRRPDQCNALVEEASASCQCPSAYYSKLLGLVSDAVEDPALFRTAGSTQIRALDWMAYQDPLRLEMSLTPSQIRERFGAVVLYYSLGGGPSTTDLNTYFLTGNITCEWHHPTFADGLFCADETVTDFLLVQSQLIGTIPPEIALLSDLQYLTLSHNSIGGPLPSALARLTKLESLIVKDNLLTGTLPESLSLSPRLRYMDLGINRIGGTFPDAYGKSTSLKDILLSRNDLSGTLPASIGQSTVIKGLELASNNLVGTLPDLSPLSCMEVLDMSFNSLSGTIPSSLTTLPSLIILVLTQNSFTGSIPPLGGVNAGLADLKLSMNQLNGTLDGVVQTLPSATLQSFQIGSNMLSGTIPPLLFAMSQWASSLQLQNNRLEGSIPTEIGQLGLATEIHLWNNTLSGTIPSEIGLMTSLRILDLSENGARAGIDGRIPSEIGNMTSLEIFFVHGNLLSGTVPTELGGCTNLREFDVTLNGLEGDIGVLIDSLPSFIQAVSLSNQFFNGTIPSTISRLSTLQRLILPNNMVMGTLPSEIGLLGSLDMLSLDFNLLTGTLPNQMSMLTTLKFLDVSSNRFTGSSAVLGMLPAIETLRLFNTSFDGVAAMCQNSFGASAEVAANLCDDTAYDCICCTHCCSVASGSFEGCMTI